MSLRRLAAIAATLVIAVLIVGCGNRSSAPAIPDAAPTANLPPTPPATSTFTPVPSPSPTRTPSPTPTPTPTIAPTPQPQVLFTYSRALQLLDSGFPDQAVAQFGLVIRFLPGFAEAYLGRARAYIADDHGVLAMRDLNRAVELKPALAVAYLVRGRLHLQMGDDADARSDLDKALSLFEAALVRTDEVKDGATEARGLLEELN